MNKVIIRGNNTREIEIKKTNSGKSVCEFTIAINEKYGENENTEFIDCRAWEKHADNIARYLKKGNSILIEGKLKNETYENQSGHKVKKTLVVVNSFEFLTPKDTSNVSTETKEPATEVESYEDVRSIGASKTVDIDTDDLPFY